MKMFLFEIIVSREFYSEIGKEMMIWAFRSGVSVVTLFIIQRDFRKFVEWLGKKML